MDHSCDAADELDIDEGVRALLLLMPRIMGRAKRSMPPSGAAKVSLQPRHLSLLAHLQFDGPMTVNAIAGCLELAPATVSLMVSDLSRQGVLERWDDCDDRRRTIVSIADDYRGDVDRWLEGTARAWRRAIEPLTPRERALFVSTMRTFEREVNAIPDHEASQSLPAGGAAEVIKG